MANLHIGHYPEGIRLKLFDYEITAFSLIVPDNFIQHTYTVVNGAFLNNYEDSRNVIGVDQNDPVIGVDQNDPIFI